MVPSIYSTACASACTLFAWHGSLLASSLLTPNCSAAHVHLVGADFHLAELGQVADELRNGACQLRHAHVLRGQYARMKCYACKRRTCLIEAELEAVEAREARAQLCRNTAAHGDLYKHATPGQQHQRIAHPVDS